MAVMQGHEPVTSFEQWYEGYSEDSRDGCLEFRNLAPCAQKKWRLFDKYKNEMDVRVSDFDKLEKLGDGEVISPKPDLPNISSGETAGLVRRIARNLVQNTPNVEVISKFDDDSVQGVFSRYVLTSKIIGSDRYSNDMQQNLFCSTKSSLILGFDCVIPVLLQDSSGSWFIKYDTIHYRDVFPEPGCKDVREATSVFIRRYLTQGEVAGLIRDEVAGWDTKALKLMMKTAPQGRERQSASHQDKKRGQIPEGYEIITWYSNTGEPFLTFCANTKILLRIEKNKHPLRQHPVHFLVLEKDDQHPLGKSQVELLVGRQDFQDLMLNGAMKLWYRNINPSIIGYGTVNSVPNLSPGKYTQISNPNARLETFEVNTQTLMQYGTISQQNLGSMVNLVGSADQQMATQAGSGMSATPQGVEAQESLVDITTNNYQKAIEAFFSHYCSYALTIYFQELKATKKVAPTAEARLNLLNAGLPAELLDTEDGTLEIDFEELAVEYYVRCVPGSLVEMEDEKQLRILNELFVPLSQAMPALAAVQDQQMIAQATKAMAFIIGKQIELSGASTAKEIGMIWKGQDEAAQQHAASIAAVEEKLSGVGAATEAELEMNTAAIQQLQEQVSLLTQNMQMFFERVGVVPGASGEQPNNSGQDVSSVPSEPSTLNPASA